MIDDVVISGVSGRFPESSDMEEFKENLLAGVDLVTDDERRWPSGTYGLPSRSGKLKDLTRFDAHFFGVHARQAAAMDPQLRALLELSHEAIVDSGTNPAEVWGSRTGVFVGVFDSETQTLRSNDVERCDGYGLTGCARSMFANRISYAFNFNGPSLALETACSSSLLALHQAVTAMRSGQCDAAIVGGVNIMLDPMTSLQYKNLNMLSADGKCKAFDATGDGYVRSEAAVVIYLTKKSSAKRIYATVVNTKANSDGYKEEGITFPSGHAQKKLLQELYAEAGVDPADVDYVECHGTGTAAGDPHEANALVEVFCKGRSSALLIGSVKSNMGHSEAASGLCSIAKVIVAMETGVIPANLHYSHPNPNIPGLVDGRLRVVTKNVSWNGGLAGVNSFGFGGANVHALLRSNPVLKTPILEINVPSVVCVSGRTATAVTDLIDQIKSQPLDSEFLSLLYELHGFNIRGHPYRGYSVIKRGALTTDVTISECSGEKRPVWFVFSGMGTQWAGMGKDLMQLEIFERCIRKCSVALQPTGFDLYDMIMNGTTATYVSCLNSFVGIAAIQVALVDLLAAMGIHPDGMIGHSAGELGCGYADDTLTAEQTVLMAYWRGRSILETELPLGSMAAVGLTWEEAKARCPPGVTAACHNGQDSVTVAGEAEDVARFVETLKKDGVFAKEVNSSGLAFHSPCVQAVAPKLMEYLNRLTPNPKPRSHRWISTSIPEEAWSSDLARTFSGAYQVNNMLSPVLFHEAIAHVPASAVVVEIAPHCLLQSILKRSLPASCTYVGLMSMTSPSNVDFLLSSLGRLYNAGLHPNIHLLRGPTSSPVPRGTRMLSPTVQWDHSTSWDVASFKDRAASNMAAGEMVVEVDVRGDRDMFLAGHVIDGQIVYPAAGHLFVVWRAFAKLHGVPHEDFAVVFQEVHFKRSVIIPEEGSIKLVLNILKVSGDFEIHEGGTLTTCGRITVCDGDVMSSRDLKHGRLDDVTEGIHLSASDVYKELRLRGHHYEGMFKGITALHPNSQRGILQWNGNWIAFLDSIMQFSIFGLHTRELYKPTFLERAVVHPKAHITVLGHLQGGQDVAVSMRRDANMVRAGGVVVVGMTLNPVPRTQPSQLTATLESYVFVPYDNPKTMTRLNALTITVQIVLENIGCTDRLNIVEVLSGHSSVSILSRTVLKILETEFSPLVEVVVTTSSNSNILRDVSGFHDIGVKITRHDFSLAPAANRTCNLMMGTRVLGKDINVLRNMAASVADGGFILLEEDEVDDIGPKVSDVVVVSKQRSDTHVYLLLRKVSVRNFDCTIEISATRFDWVDLLAAEMSPSVAGGRNVMLVSRSESQCGIVGLVNCIRQEPGGRNLRCVFLKPYHETSSCTSEPAFSAQLERDLVMNVHCQGSWGCYRHVRLDSLSHVGVLHAYVGELVAGGDPEWIEGPSNAHMVEKLPGKNLCCVHVVCMNTRGVTTNTSNPHAVRTEEGHVGIIGFSGRDLEGRRVMSVIPGCTLSTTVLADSTLLWDVPASWSLGEASTIPVAYSMGYYALVVRSRARSGESVLIQDGRGATGQAAIAIALRIGCDVFTTVDSDEERTFLKARFTKLNDDNIVDLRTPLRLEEIVMEATSGRGVDVVLNSPSGKHVMTSLRCLSKKGRFIEVVKVEDSNSYSHIDERMYAKNISVTRLTHDCVLQALPEVKRQVFGFIEEGIENGTVQPLSGKVFAITQIKEAFACLVNNKHSDNVLVQVRSEKTDSVTNSTLQLIPAIPMVYMDPQKVYIIVGGLGGMGLELANWLVERGAANLVLTSRNGVTTGYQALRIHRWREQQVKVLVPTADVTDLHSVNNLVQQAVELGSVGGIFNLAGVLRAGLMYNQTVDEFDLVCASKVQGTRHLDAVSRNQCPHLDWFVVFSSVSCGRGVAGQSNYGFANSVMERICEERRGIGLPGLAVQWGPVDDVGLVVNHLGAKTLDLGNMIPQRISSCLRVLDSLLKQPHAVVSSTVWAQRQPGSQSESTVVSALVSDVANILGIKELKAVPVGATLGELGMDSLMLTKVDQILRRSCNTTFTVREIRDVTFEKLRELSEAGHEVD